MIAWGLFVSTVDNFIRPWLVSFGAAMPFTVIFLGVLGGFIAFGFLGLFIGSDLARRVLQIAGGLARNSGTLYVMIEHSMLADRAIGRLPMPARWQTFE